MAKPSTAFIDGTYIKISANKKDPNGVGVNDTHLEVLSQYEHPSGVERLTANRILETLKALCSPDFNIT